jgi:hypothetical protein|tara:strand:+ start:1969 stop:2388 length:420 start_codon:yes stop_codon:yes gene_type:complete
MTDYVRRLKEWSTLRKQIESAINPYDLVFKFWNKIPTNSKNVDPYDEDTWPDPWEMILENDYCAFKKILGIMYTFQLTDRFSQSSFEINITLDQKESRYVYILLLDKTSIGIYTNGNAGFYTQSNLVPQVHYSKLPQYS